MRYGNSYEEYPQLKRFLQDPFIHSEVMGMIEDAELMGNDLDDPEVMGGLIKGIANIVKTIKKRRAARKASGESAPTLSLQTSQGTAAIGPGGLTWTGAPGTTAQSTLPIGNTGYQIAPVQQGNSIMDKIKQNPALIAGAVAIPVLLMVLSKSRSKEK